MAEPESRRSIEAVRVSGGDKSDPKAGSFENKYFVTNQDHISGLSINDVR